MAIINGAIGPEYGNLQNAQIMIAEADASHRNALVWAFGELGCERITAFDELADLRKAMQGDAELADRADADGDLTTPDLLVIADDFSDQSIKFIDAVRHGRVGRNPFVVVIVTTARADARHIAGLIRQGADDVVVQPITSKTLSERIEYVAIHRRPFVVTSNYVGPDRRQDDDRPSTISQLEVPNTLLQHLTGNPGSNVVADDHIRETVEAIIAARLEQHAQSLGVLSHLLIEAHLDGKNSAGTNSMQMRAWFNVMLSLMRDIQRIGDQVDNIAMIELAKTLRQQIQTIARRWDSLEEQDLHLLRDLGEAVKMTIGLVALPNPDINNLARTYKKHGEQPIPPQGPLMVPKNGDKGESAD
ncbi:MAG: response regulator transcription factor [Alphaproteobacteria bacterium]|nr:response regulator transcription factor [Alphaproteobacteria bacterium SS10]